MTLLQNAALCKTLGAVTGSSGNKISAIAAVESVEVFAEAATGRFLAQTMCDPRRAEIGQVERALEGAVSLSLGGSSSQEEANVVGLGPCRTSTPAVWEAAIMEAANSDMMVYTNGSRDQEGRVEGGWHADGNGPGSVAVGLIATVWDGKVAGIRQALRLTPDVGILVLSDSRAALLGMRRAARSGHGRTKHLVEVIEEVGRSTGIGLVVRFGWVKAHVRIRSNVRLNLMANTCWRESLLPQVTEGGVRAMWKDERSSERARSGFGMGRVVRWNRRAALRYTHLRVG